MPEMIEISGFGKTKARKSKKTAKKATRTVKKASKTVKKASKKTAKKATRKTRMGKVGRPTAAVKTMMILEEFAKKPSGIELKRETMNKMTVITLKKEARRLKKAVSYLSKGDWVKAANAAYRAGIHSAFLQRAVPKSQVPVSAAIIVAARNIILYAVKRMKKSKV